MLALAALLALTAHAHAAQAPPAVALCATIEAAARDHNLPAPFFTRLIWRESRFHARALSPAGAQGVAQFMPATAAERGLTDPFAAPAALQHSASFLEDLRATFGNLGLAAAAYNAGAGRVTRWLAGQADLPQETLDYVLAITGHEAADWRAKPAPALRADEHFDCTRYAAIAAREPDVHASAGGAATPSAPAKPWAVILIGSPARDKAVSEYAQVRSRFSGILGGLQTRVVHKRVSGIVVPRFIVQIERGTRGEADSLCGRLQRAGGACFVLANRG
ncbi:Lytic transglycosylase [Beijerinckiaceae bacterium RH AL1]|nr:Lytic transglycosylase [Beijerinckiaceae bacterium RH CH11]VVB48439.1 Lytic transglycosylase [Beijerinckiaceae bacterium RH AL8]VVC56353.1 Lytic transglycosylase [Beijerinckiaceae bacterium RH AL1]